MLIARACAVLSFALAAGTAAADPSQSFGARELLRLNRICEIEAAPDGGRVVYTVRTTDADANATTTSIWLIDTNRRNAAPVRLTDDAHSESAATWSADGRAVYFLSSRSGSAQVWRTDAAGGNAVQITNLPLDVGSYRVSPRSDFIFVTLDVYRHCADLGCTKRRLDAAAASAASGRVRTQLFAGHWDSWADGRRSQLFSMPLDKRGIAGGEPVKLSIDIEGDIPDKPFGGRESYAVSPDGHSLVFAANTAGAQESWSANVNLYQVLATGGARAPNGRPLKDAEPRNLTVDNRLRVAQPAFSPDGSQLAYLATDRPVAADRRHLVLLDLKSGAARGLTQAWDQSIVNYAWSRDGKSLVATTDHLGQRPLWNIDARTGAATSLTGPGDVEAFSVGARTVYYSVSTLASPAEIFSVETGGGKTTQVTRLNQTQLARYAMSAYEPFSFAGSGGETVHGYLVEPAEFKSDKTYPVALLLHDGPHGGFANRWDWRWNAQIFAAAGFGVVMIDYHGSTGYGQAFADSIEGNGGGKPLDDINAGLDAVLKQHPWLDGSRLCALGDGYGGYLVDWIAGQAPARFRCLVSHAGTFDDRSAYYSTDELWAPELEMNGAEFENPAAYARQNPIDNVKNWKTPMLITHGQLDFRVPYTQSLAAFTAAQRRGVLSELLVFPDETHWISKPANVVQWYDTVLEWMKKLTRR